ncbi:MAG: bifunctional metallophosphatase/5'-nucleotidase [Lachnospiraceae bacterium]|nr:bifunctional metallophosphatase/5'-nucleotidase [Lachnospiraceae bacterium]
MKKKILSLLMAAVMLFGTGCQAVIDLNEETGDLKVNGIPLEELVNEGIQELAGNQEEKTGDIQEPAGNQEEKTGDIVIVYTNDVHCSVDGDIGYAGVAAYRNEMAASGNDVLLVDCGDSIQGGPIGTLTEGEAVVRIMNAAGYDIGVPGNHDFDYGAERMIDLFQKADFPFVCCNLIDLRTGERVFDPYRILECGGKKIAFVGVTAPHTITESAPVNFQDKDGKLLYDMMLDETPDRFYRAVQDAVDEARQEGAELCILLSHLGINATYTRFLSVDVIRNTSGIDAVLDAHSHSVVEDERVKNKDGKEVLLTQTGSHLDRFGKLTIHPDGSMASSLVEESGEKDPEVEKTISEEYAEFQTILDQKIGTTDYNLMATTLDRKVDLVRNSETNLGDLAADACRFASGAEIGLINGGGIRDNILKGEITYGDLMQVYPFGNEIIMKKLTGQQIMDALEYSVSSAPVEYGGFLQVSGLTFDVDLDKDPQVQRDTEGMFTGFGSEERRVSNIKVNGEDLDPEKTYLTASIEYLLGQCGNGYSMFTGEKEEMEGFLDDLSSLIRYLESMGGKVSEEYADENGQGRIHFLQE